MMGQANKGIVIVKRQIIKLLRNDKCMDRMVDRTHDAHTRVCAESDQISPHAGRIG
jgi:hypothetical protein